MLITTTHLLALNELAGDEAAGHAVHALAEDDLQEHIYRELELQGLVLLEVPRSYRLTFAGREACGMLAAMREAALLPPLDRLKTDWRFLGSDLLATLQAAQQKKGRVGSLTAQALSARGLTESVHDTLEQRSVVRLNRYGEAWLDFAGRYRPRLEINGDLANSIHHMHPGYTGRPDANIPAEHISLLEAMDLLTWSVPEGTIYALTIVGQAVMRAYSLLQRESLEQLRAFAITEAEVELLAVVEQLAEPASGSHDPQLRPDKKTLHRVLVDRMVKRYQELIGRYGRTIKERSAKKRQAVALLEHLKDHDKWFNTFWELDELLVSLEAFDLLRAGVEETKTVYRLTPNGRKIVAEQDRSPRDITATAVKVLTTAVTRFHAPADPWVEQAREEGLIATGESPSLVVSMPSSRSAVYAYLR